MGNLTAGYNEAIKLNHVHVETDLFQTEDIGVSSRSTTTGSLVSWYDVNSARYPRISQQPTCYHVIRTKERWNNWQDWCRE
jgi:hypothetical protein